MDLQEVNDLTRNLSSNIQVSKTTKLLAFGCRQELPSSETREILPLQDRFREQISERTSPCFQFPIDPSKTKPSKRLL